MMNKRVVYKFIFRYKRDIFIIVFLTLFSSIFFLAAPYFSKLFIDKAFISKNLINFFKLSIISALVFISTTLIRIYSDIIKNKIAIKLRLNLTKQFITKFYLIDFEFFQSHSIGENVYRLTDIESVIDFLLEHCPQILVDIFKFGIILVISFWLNFQMTIFLLMLSPLFLLQSVYLQRKLNPIYEKMWKFNSKLSKQIYEAFSKILIIKALGLESFQKRKYLKSLIENLRWRIKSFRWSIISSVTSAFLSKAVYGLITLYGGWLIIKGRLSLGSYTAAMIYLTQIGALLSSFSMRVEFISREIVSLEKFLEVIEHVPKLKDVTENKPLTDLRGAIYFKNVYFGYEKEKMLFQDLNLVIPLSLWVAIVGASGSGKTTLINLILRLYQPCRGQILIDDKDLRLIALKSLREKIAIATQQPLLFDVSIQENISFGLKNISQYEIEEAAKIACVHDFIMQLPDGYDTMIGEDACRLSHGLKQRIALARAIARKPQLLILDEATSSVDSLTEENILSMLRQKRSGLSTIIISHRLFSIRNADRIFFLNPEGRFEEGNHQELFSKSVFYRDFFNNQIEEIERV